MDKILSIIVPSYNMEKYLPKCLGSLIVDDPALLLRLDVIVVNDGSKDRTSEIAHEFERRYPSVFHVIDKKNGHYGSCINAALKVIQGEFVKVLDADDWFDTKIFSEYLQYIIQDHYSVDLITNNYDTVDAESVALDEICYAYPTDGIFGIGDLNAEKDRCLIMHGAAYRSSIFSEICYHQTEGIVYTDTQWMFEPMLKVNRILHFKGQLYKYLNGREGQSVDPALWVKNVYAQLLVLKSIVSVYKSYSDSVDNDHREYMVRYIARIYGLLLNVYWHYAPLCRQRELREAFLTMQQFCPKALSYNFKKTIFGNKIDCYEKWTSSAFPLVWLLLFRSYSWVRNLKILRGK